MSTPLRANLRHSSASPTSPTILSPHRNVVPPGFRAPPRPKTRQIEELTVRELRDRHRMNMRILQSPEASTSNYVHRISTEQAAIEGRLLDLEGMDNINRGLKNTRITGDDDMSVDQPSEPISRTREAKAKALAQFGSTTKLRASGSFTLQEAMELERQAYLQDKERQERILEKRKRQGLSIPGEVLTREEQAARIYAFMNHKGSDEDEDDEDEDEDDDDPAAWFEDDQDDGRKGQNIVDPDPEELYDMIRIDPGRIPYNSWYPDHRDDGE